MQHLSLRATGMQGDGQCQRANDKVPSCLLLWGPVCSLACLYHVALRSKINCKIAVLHATVWVDRCLLDKHEEECIVGMDNSLVDLADCHMHSSQGPAVDLSGKARLKMSQGSIKECVGEMHRRLSSCMLEVPREMDPAFKLRSTTTSSLFCRWDMDVGQQHMQPR